MTVREFQQRIREELSNPARWWYLSYADQGGWRGGVVVKAHGFITACEVAKSLGIAPEDCDVRGNELLDSMQEVTPEHCMNRLLSKADLEQYFGGAERW